MIAEAAPDAVSSRGGNGNAAHRHRLTLHHLLPSPFVGCRLAPVSLRLVTRCHKIALGRVGSALPKLQVLRLSEALSC